MSKKGGSERKKMVKFGTWLEGRCMAMQLAFCLLMGLRVVSASLQHSLTCGDFGRPLRSRSTVEDSLEQQHRAIVDAFGSTFSSGSEAEQHIKSDQQQSQSQSQKKKKKEKRRREQQKKGDWKSAQVRRSLSTQKQQECQAESNQEKSRGANLEAPPCSEEVARDFVSDVKSSPPQNRAFRQESSPNNESSSPSSSSYPSSMKSPSQEVFNSSDTSGNGGSSSSASNTHSPPSNPFDNSHNGSAGDKDAPSGPASTLSSARNGSTDATTSSSSDSSSTPVGGSLPEIDFGRSKDDDTAGLSNQPSGDAQTDNSNAGVNLPSNDGAPTDGRRRTTKAVAAAVGVTVPVGVIALGLIALVVLHKQRQGRRGRKHNVAAEEEEGGLTEGMDKTPEPRQGPSEHKDEAETTVGDGMKSTNLVVEATSSQIPRETAIEVAEEESQAHGGSDRPSDVSHLTTSLSNTETITASATAPEPAATTTSTTITATGTGSSEQTFVRAEAAGAGASDATHQSANATTAGRGRSLKRKPVPALLETFEPATMDNKLSTSEGSLAVREAALNPPAISVPVPAPVPDPLSFPNTSSMSRHLHQHAS